MSDAVQAMLRLARADSYRQGLKDGRAATIEELAAIVDDAERVQEVLRRRKEQRGN